MRRCPYWLLLMMMGKRGLLFILFQGLIKIAVFSAEEDSISSRSAYFITRENKQLKGYVLKVFESHSLMSCSQSCLRNAWCTSTNFKVSSNKDGKGTCELNKHEIPLINENTKFHDQQGVTFSMLLKVTYNQFILFPPLFSVGKQNTIQFNENVQYV